MGLDAGLRAQQRLHRVLPGAVPRHHDHDRRAGVQPPGRRSARRSRSPAQPMTEPLLEIAGLRTWFFTSDGVVKAVDGVDLSVDKGQVLGLVGESGSGKSVTMFSALRLVASPGRVVDGTVRFDGIDV